MASPVDNRSAVAIIGLACRLPGADSPGEFWRNLRDGVESVRRLTEAELLAAGASPADIASPNHVPVASTLADMEMFDAAFFGIPVREAELMDPQHRVFLECAWAALEDAGCDPARFEGAISVFGGGIFDSYVTWNLLPAGVFDDKAGILQTVLSNEKDYMTARVAYKFNLRGPACNVQTGCSTSLVAVHMACQSLLNFESDAALAGGVAIDVARRKGYFFHEGSVYSSDGHCRSFDADAHGTVFGNGAGVVMLKRLDDAIEDGDTIRAIILGSAINNDGSSKVGFTAPAVTGQGQVIVEALADAGVSPQTIGYVEAHGTGTSLGDPIEVQALARAFGDVALKPRSCAIGSVKSNIGHLDAAAGVSGLIKTVLALENGVIPPTLHFRRANPQVEMERTPFYVAAAPVEWRTGTSAGVPRRAGVSSFGIGGTNAHVVLEEAPVAPAPAPSRPQQLVTLSARSAASLENASARLAAHLRETPGLNLADAAFTLHTGRVAYAHRRAIVCATTADAASWLDAGAGEAHAFSGQPPRIGLMFPGQGSQYSGMARRLYDAEPIVRREFDACAAVLRGQLDLSALMHGSADGADRLTRTEYAQPALFAIEYALAALWRHWGIEPEGLIGHSIGEYVAATLAGVFSLEEALTLVAARGRMMQQAPAGAMTAVPLPAARLRLGEGSGVEIAAVNAPELCVVAGPTDAIAAFERRHAASGTECRRLHTSHAFHSAAMDSIVEPFAAVVGRVTLREPRQRFISNVTGTWITPEQATDAGYWGRHLREPVLFSAGITTMLSSGIDLLLETGPGRTLGSLARLHGTTVSVAASLPAAREQADDHAVLLDAAARLWTRGASIDWTAFHGDERRRRVPLPTYPFERTRCWIEPDEDAVERRRARVRANEKQPWPETWMYMRGWTEALPAAYSSGDQPPLAPSSWLIIARDAAIAARCADSLALHAARGVTIATFGPAFSRVGARQYTISPNAADYDAVLTAALLDCGEALRIVHLGNAYSETVAQSTTLEHGFYSLARLAGALQRVQTSAAISLTVVTQGVDDVSGSEILVPDRATLAAACLVLAQEQPHIRCQRVDLPSPTGARDEAALLAELIGHAGDREVAIRGGRRWIPVLRPLTAEPRDVAGVRPGGHYLITGGLGTIGVSVAVFLAHSKARLTLVGRTPLPARETWPTVDPAAPLDQLSIRMLKVLELERLGAQVHVVAADVADAGQLAAAFAEAERRFGPIDGVISAAGLMDESSFAPLAATDRARCDRHFAPKLAGMRALEAAAAGRSMDFCIVMSSLSAVLGGVGYGAYAAANAYLDAFVAAHNRHGDRPWTIINWDAWHPVGGQLPATSLLARLAMTQGEGVVAFDRLMRYRGLQQVFVSTADLVARVAFAVPERPSPVPVAADATALQGEEVATLASDVTLTEAAILAIWQQVLGAPRVEVHDTFLDLGGNSLTAIQVIGRIEDQLGVRVTIEEFIFQTAGQLAALCDARAPRPGAGEVAPAAEQPAAPAPARGWGRLRNVLRSRTADADVVRS